MKRIHYSLSAVYKDSICSVYFLTTTGRLSFRVGPSSPPGTLHCHDTKMMMHGPKIPEVCREDVELLDLPGIGDCMCIRALDTLSIR
jgi:hypothetical protein